MIIRNWKPLHNVFLHILKNLSSCAWQKFTTRFVWKMDIFALFTPEQSYFLIYLHMSSLTHMFTPANQMTERNNALFASLI